MQAAAVLAPPPQVNAFTTLPLCIRVCLQSRRRHDQRVMLPVQGHWQLTDRPPFEGLWWPHSLNCVAPRAAVEARQPLAIKGNSQSTAASLSRKHSRFGPNQVMDTLLRIMQP